MFKFKKIDHIQLAAPKNTEDIARTFFVKVLGFVEIEKPEELRKRGGVWFENGNVQIHIGVEDGFVPQKKAHPAIEVTNIEELKTHLKENDVEVIEDNNLPSANRFYTSDPFGNRLEFLEWEK